MEPFEIMVSESQERMLCVARPECVGALLDVCERWEVLATTIGCVTAGDRFQVLHRGNVVADLPVRVLIDDCPLYDLQPVPPSSDLYGAPERRADRRRAARGDAARAAALGEPGLAPAGVRAVRPDRPVAHGAPARRGRRGRARAGCGGRTPGDRGVDRRQRPASRLRSSPRRRRGGVRMRRQPGLRRCRAARPDQLPELRQPREAARGLAARPRRSRDWPRRARRSVSRSSAATSRSTTRRRPGRSSPRPWSAWSASCPAQPAPGGWGSRARATRSRSSARSSPRWSDPSSAKLRGQAPVGELPPADARQAPDRPPGGPSRACGPGRSTAPTTSPRAGSRPLWPSRASPAGSVRRSACLTGSTRSARRRGERSSSRVLIEALAGFVVIGEVGGETLAIEGLLELAVSELRAARDAGLAEWV